jgi:hypothetical protein
MENSDLELEEAEEYEGSEFSLIYLRVVFFEHMLIGSGVHLSARIPLQTYRSHSVERVS